MIVLYPAYYESFVCIADRCEDTCCAGWEIDIDDESYRYYRGLAGAIGERLRENMREYEEEDAAYERHGFRLKKDGRCPFLNSSGLCDLYIELGSESLCDVCANTPRNFMEYGGAREISISASCPEAARLIYGKKEPITFVSRAEPGELDLEESEEEIVFARQIRDARDEAVRILQDRTLSIWRRAGRFLIFAERVQDCLNDNAPERIADVIEDKKYRFPKDARPGGTYRLFLERMRTFTGLDSIRTDWDDRLMMLQKRYVLPEDGEENYTLDRAAWRQFMSEEEREYEYEHFLVYYAFLFLVRCVDDYDFLGKAKFCLACLLMMQDMDMAWFQRNGRYTLEDRLCAARIFAREVEHSGENLDYLAEALLFEAAYQVDALLYSL